MKNVTKYTLLLLWMVSTWSFGQEPQDCLSIQGDFVALTDSGKYRFTAEEGSHRQSQGLSSINFTELTSYQQYITASQRLIADKNPRATMPCPIITDTYQQLAKQNNWSATPEISQLIAPFELPQGNKEKAILLIHGLTDSPFIFHDLAQFFYQQGFTVRTLLLPGHGTAPSGLLDVSYQEWQHATKFAIETTLHDFEQVYLGGFSTGGALIFDYLMQQPVANKKIKGLLMWSPASKAKNDSAWLAQYVDYIPFVDWIDLDADIDFAKYESFPYNAAAQVHGIMSRIVGENAMDDRVLHDIPLFVVASEHDQTINTKQTLLLIEQWQQQASTAKTKKSALIYYGDKGSLPPTLLTSIKVMVPSCSAGEICEGIFDIAHTATTNAPDNPHYGAAGQYRNCGHYQTEPARYQECKEASKTIKGELRPENLNKEQPLQRLTYNPYYQHMLATMTGFLRATQLSVSD
ncbi:alpha/beta hydrolase [Colwellia piezophila]|uniref:alpha/beta hydrolase n=1 Tax=Colwellia piezophila TaxID=211668 RepID=UPI00037D80D1|nr:alpha/beta fold hydrolase [Colwellia piezophila]